MDIRIPVPSISNDTENELYLAKNYWLNTIQPFILGRRLHGVEFFIAHNAYMQLCLMEKAFQNQGAAMVTQDEMHPEGESPEFLKPKEMYADENLNASILAQIAALLLKPNQIGSPFDAVSKAHELLIAAEEYIDKLPKQKHGTGTLTQVLEQQFQTVSFDEILRSNETGSGRLPLLPPVQQKRNEGRLTKNALIIAIKRFLTKQQALKTRQRLNDYDKTWANLQKQFGQGNADPLRPGNNTTLTFEEWQKQNQDSISDCLSNERLSFVLLAELRYERFKAFFGKQQKQALKRSFKPKRKSKR